MPGPNWLTAWVKVNHRHVAYGGPSSSSSASVPATPSPRFGRSLHGRNRERGGDAAGAAASKPPSNSNSSSANGAAAVAGENGSRASAPQPPSPKNNRSLRSGSVSSTGAGWRSSESSASNSKREEPLFGISTALRGDDLSVARSVPGTRSNTSGRDEAEAAAFPRRRSGKKSASFDENRAQARESDLASAHTLLAGFFAAPPLADIATAASDTKDNIDDSGSAATYPRFLPASSSSGGRRRVAAVDDQPAFKSTGRYLNEAAFVQQLEQRQRADSRRPTRDDGRTSSSVASAPNVRPSPSRLPTSTPIPETSLPIRSSSRHSRLPHSASSVKSDASPSAMSAPPAFGGGLKLFPPSFFPVDNNKPCDSCQTLQAKLEAALDDVEYLRTAVLEQEMAAAASTVVPAASASSSKSVPDPKGSAAATGKKLPSHRPTVIDASRQVGDATHRHRKQVEQLTKERIRWQQDIHFKLHKFANLCKDLNEESVVRNETALTLEQELIQVKEERDAVLKERNDLRSRVEQLERYEAECKRMTELLRQHEADGIQKSEETIRSRDGTIREMSNRLDKTLDELEMERAQRQRRQIIFPGNGAHFNEPPNL